MVSMANCAPPKRGSPSTTTSSLRASATGTCKSNSLTSMFVVTRPPASLQTRAAADSTANPRLANHPARAHAARWWPNESNWRPHRHKRGQGRSGRSQQQNTKQMGRNIFQDAESVRSGHSHVAFFTPLNLDTSFTVQNYALRVNPTQNGGHTQPHVTSAPGHQPQVHPSCPTETWQKNALPHTPRWNTI